MDVQRDFYTSDMSRQDLCFHRIAFLQIVHEWKIMDRLQNSYWVVAVQVMEDFMLVPDGCISVPIEINCRFQWNLGVLNFWHVIPFILLYEMNIQPLTAA